MIITFCRRLRFTLCRLRFESSSTCHLQLHGASCRLLQYAVAAFVAVVSCLTIPLNRIAAESPGFESVIAPLLIKRCVECHQGTNPAGGLLLTNQRGFMQGGDSGDAINLESVLESHLLQRVEQGEMPPDKQGHSQKLGETEIQLLRDWLTSGADWPNGRELDFFEKTNELRAGRDWWSLRPLQRPAVPTLKQHPQPQNPIDAFVLAKLEAHDGSLAPRADRRTLIRRVYYDLLGLPPTEIEIESFVNSEAVDAWEQLVDELLARPQYGERWGRYWLDLARYADTSGYERDQEKPFAWKYRDWVIAAFNQDMPYQQFIRHQLAGDEVPDRTEQSVIATGFLRLGTWNDEPNDKEDYRYERLEDLVHTTSSAFLALTVKCARCHSHKFDAITQEDYYRMASSFWLGPLAATRSSNHLGGPTAEEIGFTEVLAWTDVGMDALPLNILKNGDRNQPLRKVIPASLSTVPALEQQYSDPPIDSKTSLRRLALANWIANPMHPLTARVAVNRLWQRHFGKAIVRTPNNFGFLADPPTHPKLLDWLATRFLAEGGRIKSMHRLILNSRTWQQSVIHPEADQLEQRDSGNRWWWRFERRRLDAEMLRDSLLAVSEQLDLKVGGPGFKSTISPNALEGLSRKSSAWEAAEPQDQKRRSVYMYLKRGLLPPMMTTFDLCDPTQSCGQRDVTTAPTQALMLLNNEFVHDCSEYLAVTIAGTESHVDQRVQLAWSNVLKRQPTPSEYQLSLEHLERQERAFTQVSKPDELSGTGQDSVDSALVLHLRADQAVVAAEGTMRVSSIADLSGHSHRAFQVNSIAQPVFQRHGFGGKPTLVFNGQAEYMKIDGDLLQRPECTIVCVANDNHALGHREVISNWNGAAGNSTSSLFLGITEENTVRFSDAFSAKKPMVRRSEPFILTAVNGSSQVSVFQNGRSLGHGSPLTGRKLGTEWVLGQQGNINGEYWSGGIAETRIYNRELTEMERRQVEAQLSVRYGIQLTKENQDSELPPATLALASLCHVLMNSNEFLYLD